MEPGSTMPGSQYVESYEDTICTGRRIQMATIQYYFRAVDRWLESISGLAWVRGGAVQYEICVDNRQQATDTLQYWHGYEDTRYQLRVGNRLSATDMLSCASSSAASSW
eukprot:2234118-Rhodomonas_salina.2